MLSRLIGEEELLVKKLEIMLNIGIMFLKRDIFNSRLDGAKIINAECEKVSLLNTND